MSFGEKGAAYHAELLFSRVLWMHVSAFRPDRRECHLDRLATGLSCGVRWFYKLTVSYSAATSNFRLLR